MELSKKFANRPNGRIRLKYNHNGSNAELDYFIHRATAVVGVIFIFGFDNLRVLVTQRSDKMLDEAGKFGVICGYLDWDETLYEAMIREVYEETSLYIPDYEKYLIFNNDRQPFHVKDDPKKDKRQNVSHIFLTVLDFDGKTDQFPLAEIEKFTCRETANVSFMKMIDFYNQSRNMEWAFNHDETIQSALQFFNKNFDRVNL